MSALFLIFLWEDCVGENEFVFLSPDRVLSLPSFAPHRCRGLQFPRTLYYDTAGLVEDEAGQVGLLLGGGLEHERQWWVRRAGSWENTAETADPRLAAAGSKSADGWLVSGGYPAVSSTEVYQAGQWRRGPDLPAGLSGHCQAQLGDSVFITGGGAGEGTNTAAALQLRPGLGYWTPVTSMNAARAGHTCTQHQGSLWVLGGRGEQDSSGQYLSSVEVYKPGSKSWQPGPQLPVSLSESQVRSELIYWDRMMYWLYRSSAGTEHYGCLEGKQRRMATTTRFSGWLSPAGRMPGSPSWRAVGTSSLLW